MDFTREQLKTLLRARIAEEDIATARAAHQAAKTDRVFMEDIKPGMSLAEKRRISDHILRLMNAQ